LNKSFSRLSLLNEKMSNSYKGLFQSFFSSKKYINVKLPYYDYLRGQVFIQDLRDNYPEDMSYSFDIGHLIHMLYMDFLHQIKRGVKKGKQKKRKEKGSRKLTIHSAGSNKSFGGFSSFVVALK